MRVKCMYFFIIIIITKEGIFTICIHSNTTSKRDKMKTKINRTGEEKTPIDGIPEIEYITRSIFK